SLRPSAPRDPNHPPLSNPHSARRTAAPHLPRFPPLEVFERRPLVRVAIIRQRPASENLHTAEVAQPHSITSSASDCIELDRVRPSIFAAFKLITNSNLVGWMTG